MFNTWHREPRRRWRADKTGCLRSQGKSKKEEAFGRKHDADSCDSVSYEVVAALNLLLITYARIQLPLYTASYRLALLSAIALADDLLSHNSDALGYGNPPPTYEDAINDLPPEYSTLPASAEAKSFSPESAPPRPCRRSYQDQKKSAVSSLIDFDGSSTFRQHGKKQKAKLAAKNTTSGGAPAGNGGGGKKDDAPSGGGDKAGGNGAGSGGGDDNGGGGGGEEPWDDWTTSSNKKKSKKEEEEEKKKKEEEAAAANSGGNNLSWADDVDGDDTWAGFTSVSKNDKKKKKDLVSIAFPAAQDVLLTVGLAWL